MMQIGSTVPAHNSTHFQVRRGSFKCSGSLLNPTIRSPVKYAQLATEATKKHLSNLEKLLYKEADSGPIQDPVVMKESKSSPEGGGGRGRRVMEGLNLGRLWREMKTAEEMSPKHLNRLQRLLSMSEYSPRSSLSSRWREYHGCSDWAGMLDPLDENLRREVVRYGEFIQAAYHCFHSDPDMSPDEAPTARHVALPDRSYKVTKSLYATSSVGLPKWVDNVAPDLGWMTQRSSWIGYVAVCDDQNEIQRMGRRDIVIALRGTATCLEWAENMRDVLVQMPNQSESLSGQAKVECGFLSMYKTQGAHVPSLEQSVVEEIQRLIEQYKGEALSITVTGHSLGAALALLVANDISACAPDAPPVAVISFGGPRVGNRGFADQINGNNVKVLRVVNSQDVITKMPGMLVSESLDQKLRETGAGAAVLDAIDHSMPWAYSHVGTELRVDTKMSPFLKPNADVACCHDLEAYLHLVDGFLASNCPFRANAKRSLVRLLNEQTSNVKRLYTSRASNLSRLKLERANLNMAGVLPSPSSS